MILSEKLYSLRTKAGLSQEELAEKLNVSRQSVSKWESGASIPSIDKIIDIAKLYGISTDYLLKDEIEELPSEIVPDIYHPEEVMELSLDTVNNYLEAVDETCPRTSLGVAMCILSPVPMFALMSISMRSIHFMSMRMATGVGTGILLAFVAIAVVMFVMNAIRMGEFEFLEKDVFRLSYGVSGIVEKANDDYMPTYRRMIAYGVGLCIASVIPIATAGALGASEPTELNFTGLLLTLVALGVYMIVRACIQKGAYDKVLQRGDYTVEKKQENRKLEKFDTAYWCIITAVYLGISFYFNNWGISWIIWPVAGVAYAAARALAGSIIKA